MSRWSAYRGLWCGLACRGTGQTLSRTLGSSYQSAGTRCNSSLVGMGEPISMSRLCLPPNRSCGYRRGRACWRQDVSCSTMSPACLYLGGCPRSSAGDRLMRLSCLVCSWIRSTCIVLWTRQRHTGRTDGWRCQRIVRSSSRVLNRIVMLLLMSRWT